MSAKETYPRIAILQTACLESSLIHKTFRIEEKNLDGFSRLWRAILEFVPQKETQLCLRRNITSKALLDWLIGVTQH